VRKRGSSTALGLLLKSSMLFLAKRSRSMFRQLVEKNSDAEGGISREGAGEAYEYHNFLQADGPDMCEICSRQALHFVRKSRPTAMARERQIGMMVWGT
jgi:hypothetical protein